MIRNSLAQFNLPRSSIIQFNFYNYFHVAKA